MLQQPVAKELRSFQSLSKFSAPRKRFVYNYFFEKNEKNDNGFVNLNNV